MGKIVAYLLSLTFLLGLIIAFLFYLLPIQTSKIVVRSPLPEFLYSFRNKQVLSLEIWEPDIDEVLDIEIEKPDITAKSVLVYDLTTKKALFSKDPKEKLPIASLTKVMTAVIALENKKEDNSYSVAKENLVGENAMGLTPGEILTLEELLYGLILPSGNDAAEVLAANFPQGRNAFIRAMNDKTKALGLKDTNFTNPSGLQGDGDQYSSAYDLLVITNYALKYPVLQKVASTFEEYIQTTATHKAYYLQNETNLLTSYPGVKGIKTGYTPEAELCLITYLEHNQHKIIAVMLGSTNRRAEMKEILDYSLKTLGEIPPPHQ